MTRIHIIEKPKVEYPEHPFERHLIDHGLGDCMSFLKGESGRPVKQRIEITKDFLSAIAPSKDYPPILAADGEVYMRRDWVVSKGESYFSARIHELLLPDDDNLHCHPWRNVSVLLSGTYYEAMPTDGPTNLDQLPWQLHDSFECWENVVVKKRTAGDVLPRLAQDRHRLIVLPGEPVLSLFLMGTWEREWGFYTQDMGFVSNREYLDDLDGRRRKQTGDQKTG